MARPANFVTHPSPKRHLPRPTLICTKFPSKNCHRRVTAAFRRGVWSRKRGCERCFALVRMRRRGFLDARNFRDGDRSDAESLSDLEFCAVTSPESAVELDAQHPQTYGREVSREASTVGRDLVPHEWRRRLAAPPFAAGRVAGGNRGVRAGGRDVAGQRAAWSASALLGAHRVVYATPYSVGLDDRGRRRGAWRRVRAAGRARCYESAPASTTMRFRRHAAAAGAPDARRIRDAAGARDDRAARRRARADSARERHRRRRRSTFRCPPRRAPRSRIGLATFVVRSGPDRGPAPELPAGVVRRFARKALLPLQVAALASVLLCAIRVGAPDRRRRHEVGDPGERDAAGGRAGVAAGSADSRRAALHQCFDVHADQLSEAGLRRREAVAVTDGRDSRTRDRGVFVRRGLPGQPVPVRCGRDAGSSSRCRSR